MELNQKNILHSALLLTTGFYSGAALSLSFVNIPSILLSSNPLELWRTTFKNPVRLTLIVGTTLTSLGFSAWQYWYNGGQSEYLSVTILSSILVVYTFKYIVPANNALLSESADKKSSNEVKELVRRWGYVHFPRTIIGITSFLIMAFTSKNYTM